VRVLGLGNNSPAKDRKHKITEYVSSVKDRVSLACGVVACSVAVEGTTSHSFHGFFGVIVI
jgi:hypothetical protein